MSFYTELFHLCCLLGIFFLFIFFFFNFYAKTERLEFAGETSTCDVASSLPNFSLELGPQVRGPH